MIIEAARLFYEPPAAANPHTSTAIQIPAGASLLLVKFAWENKGNVLDVRLNNSSGTRLTQVPGSLVRTTSGNRVVSMWALVNPAPGSTAIWVRLSASFVVAFEVVCFVGTDGTSYLADVDGGRTNGATSLQTVNALIPRGTGNWLETVICGGNHALTLAPQGAAIETVDRSVRNAFRFGGSQLAPITTSNTRPGWTASGSQVMALSAVLLKPGASTPEEPPPDPDPVGGSVQTIGQMSGAGNVFRGEAGSHKVSDLATLHCGMCRVSCSPANDYFSGGAPSPAAMDAVVLSLLRAGVQPYFSFVFSDDMVSGGNIPQRNHADWFGIGQAFANRFKKGSSFLTTQGISDLGAAGYSAINEPDHAGGETPGLTHVQYRDMLRGLADGVHDSDPAGRVFPAGYLSGNRDQEFTGHGYCSAIAELINQGVLSGLDIHTYHSKTGARIHDTYNRSHQLDADRFRSACGITRADADVICTETNIRGDPDATSQGYDEATARLWFLTSMFDVWGCLRQDGKVSDGPRFPWQLWMQGNPEWYMASQLSPRVEHWCGHTYKLLLDLVWDMKFTFNDPRATGVHKLKGGGKSAWVFQNIHGTWSTRFGSSFTIDDIPAATTKVDIYDGMGLIQTVTNPSKPAHTFSTPTGKSYLFVANAE